MSLALRNLRQLPAHAEAIGVVADEAQLGCRARTLSMRSASSRAQRPQSMRSRKSRRARPPPSKSTRTSRSKARPSSSSRRATRSSLEDRYTKPLRAWMAWCFFRSAALWKRRSHSVQACGRTSWWAMRACSSSACL